MKGTTTQMKINFLTPLFGFAAYGFLINNFRSRWITLAIVLNRKKIVTITNLFCFKCLVWAKFSTFDHSFGNFRSTKIVHRRTDTTGSTLDTTTDIIITLLNISNF